MIHDSYSRFEIHISHDFVLQVLLELQHSPPKKANNFPSKLKSDCGYGYDVWVAMYSESRLSAAPIISGSWVNLMPWVWIRAQANFLEKPRTRGLTPILFSCSHPSIFIFLRHSCSRCYCPSSKNPSLPSALYLRSSL